jgi:SAM-dependent methyltransferase
VRAGRSRASFDAKTAEIEECPMAMEDVMPVVSQWSVAIEAAAALSAQLRLQQTGESAPPEVAAALRNVGEAAGVGDLSDLAPPQQAMVMFLINSSLHHALELIQNPTREPGWTYTEPAILDGYGRGSMAVPGMIASGIPELGDVGSFLDVGTGVGLLAVAAASTWPNAHVVGIDIWEPSLERARANVNQAGLDDRITLRTENLADLGDDNAFDLVWIPTFFLRETAIADALPAVLRATRSGGWVVLGLFATPPAPLAEAVNALKLLRGGGDVLEGKRAIELLERAGFSSAHVAPKTAPIPMDLVVAQKP